MRNNRSQPSENRSARNSRRARNLEDKRQEIIDQWVTDALIEASLTIIAARLHGVTDPSRVIDTRLSSAIMAMPPMEHMEDILADQERHVVTEIAFPFDDSTEASAITCCDSFISESPEGVDDDISYDRRRYRHPRRQRSIGFNSLASVLDEIKPYSSKPPEHISVTSRPCRKSARRRPSRRKVPPTCDDHVVATQKMIWAINSTLDFNYTSGTTVATVATAATGMSSSMTCCQLDDVINETEVCALGC